MRRNTLFEPTSRGGSWQRSAPTVVVAFVVAQLEPAADVRRAANALRTPALEVLWCEVDSVELVAAVGYNDLSVLRAASERMRGCPGVRATYLSLEEPHA